MARKKKKIVCNYESVILEPWDVCEVYWLDASARIGWQSTEDCYLYSDNQLGCVTVGFFYNVTEEAVTFVMTRSDLDNGNGDPDINGIFRIPLGMIKGVRVLSHDKTYMTPVKINGKRCGNTVKPRGQK